MDSTPPNKKTTGNCRGSEAGTLRTHVDTPRLYELIADACESVCRHLMLSHPIFDYIERSAQPPELITFAHAEISEEHRLLGLEAHGGWAFSRMTAPLLGKRGYGALPRTDGTVSNQATGSRYFSLLHHAVLKLSATETVFMAPIAQDLSISRHTAASEWGSHLHFLKSGSLIQLVQANRYQKVFLGCVRLGVASQDCDTRMSSNSTSESIQSTLHAALLEQPLDALGRAQAISAFLDGKVEYYDRLFNDILWSNRP